MLCDSQSVCTYAQYLNMCHLCVTLIVQLGEKLCPKINKFTGASIKILNCVNAYQAATLCVGPCQCVQYCNCHEALHKDKSYTALLPE